uniref:Uncharacterized protein n=1 Tax=Corethron hystrix TaxID=216773 RepID=A0A7S1G121_9STRA|mmetsp:Transcript_8737/g.19215  ORF Transcript_8737/g.19215 Transcript_8737/m.19215 type:complete len:456 (+) Transcript_8737:86-1453(+)
MRRTQAAAFLFSLSVEPVRAHASFTKDVIRKSDFVRRQTAKKQDLQKALYSRIQLLEGHPQEEQLRDAHEVEETSLSLSDFIRRQLGGDNDDGDGNGYDYDITDYSLKFARCQMIKSYSDEAAEGGYEDVLVAQNFIVFRLCPTDTCSSSFKFGCRSNYGEYILPLADYLEVMSEYVYNQREAYCEYCGYCFENNRRLNRNNRKLDEGADEDEDENEDVDEEANNDDGGGGDDDAGENEDEANDDEEDENDDVENDDENNDDEENDNEENDDGNDGGNNDDGDANNVDDDKNNDGEANDDYVPAYCEDHCANDNYYNKCQYQGGNYAVDYTDWFECTKYNSNDGNTYYIMAHCGNDSGVDIEIGIFSDKYCTKNIGGPEIASEYTGVNFESDGMAEYYPEQCVTCNATALNYQAEAGGYDQDGDSINDLCANIYQKSARCGVMMGSYENYDVSLL